MWLTTARPTAGTWRVKQYYSFLIRAEFVNPYLGAGVCFWPFVGPFMCFTHFIHELYFGCILSSESNWNQLPEGEIEFGLLLECIISVSNIVQTRLSHAIVEKNLDNSNEWNKHEFFSWIRGVRLFMNQRAHPKVNKADRNVVPPVRPLFCAMIDPCGGGACMWIRPFFVLWRSGLYANNPSEESAGIELAEKIVSLLIFFSSQQSATCTFNFFS